MINYIKGDATHPVGDVPKIIVHICNDIGAWGKGFVLALSKKWKTPENNYRLWYVSGSYFGVPFLLGNIQLIEVENKVWVCNLIGQKGIKKRLNVPPIRYEAVKDGLKKLNSIAKNVGATIHMPRIGCGLAGGRWERIEPIIKEELDDLSVFVYDL